jgi:hypothetical protein
MTWGTQQATHQSRTSQMRMTKVERMTEEQRLAGNNSSSGGAVKLTSSIGY